MSDLKAKMHQIRFRLALRPTPRWGAYIASPDPLVRFKGPTSKRREGRGEEGRGGEKMEGEGRGEERRRWGKRKEDPERSAGSKFATTPLLLPLNAKGYLRSIPVPHPAVANGR